MIVLHQRPVLPRCKRDHLLSVRLSVAVPDPFFFPLIDLLQSWFPAVDVAPIAVLLLLVGVTVAFLREWGSPDVVALVAMGLLLGTGLLPVTDTAGEGGEIHRGLLSVFSNGAPITIAAMFVLSAGLERAGAIDAMGRIFTRIAGRSELRVLLVLVTMAVGLSAFINNTPVVVVFLPIVLAHARATGLRASKLLIPLSFASILGGTCTLVGTSTNLVVAGVAQDYGQPAFGMFEITKLGWIYAVIGSAYLFTIGRRLLPARSSLAELLEPQSERHFLSQFVVDPGSTLAGKPVTETLLKQFPGTQVLEVRRLGEPVHAPLDRLEIQEGDRLLVTLPSSFARKVNETDGIRFLAQASLREVETRELKMVEGIVGPRSDLAGQTLAEIDFRRRHGLQVLAVHRQGANLGRDMRSVRLDFGDTLLMEGTAEAINRLQSGHDFITITEPPEVRVVPGKMWIAVAIAVAFVAGASLEILPVPGLAILVALTMVLSRCLTIRQAYDAIQWNLVFLILGMLSLGLAMEQSGAANLLVDGVMGVFGDFSPFIVLSVVYLLASVLTEMISNNAVAALLTPIVIGLAERLEYAGQIGVDPRPFIIAVMFGCSASFATPIGYQTNTYVYGAGGYQFRDFPRVGVPLNVILWIVASFCIPWLWPFR